MNPSFLLRLALDTVMAGLLLLALAYYWLDNTVHEIVGTALFLLIGIHVTFNRRWFGTIGRRRRAWTGRVGIAVNGSLAAAMLALLVTSLMISRTLFDVLALGGGFTARQIHTLAAYWVLIVVSVHIGLRWSAVMAAMRDLLGLRENALRTAILRIAALVVAAYGVRSSFDLGIGGKLSAELSMDFWDFGASTAPFFAKTLSIAWLYVFLSHNATKWLSGRRRTRATVP